MLTHLSNLFKRWFLNAPIPARLSNGHQLFLSNTVSFYRQLNTKEQAHFEACCIAFIKATKFTGHDTDVTNEDMLLVAAGSVILAWGFPKWHYVKVNNVILLATAIKHHQLGNITGLVGTHEFAGKMFLSKPALHHGFSNDEDNYNVAIHEFAHLIDMADGQVDGLPKLLNKHAYALPWLNLIKEKTKEIQQRRSSIRDYAATNEAEFFAVATEYFFERPKMLKQKHPELYSILQHFYRQDRAAVQADMRSNKM